MSAAPPTFKAWLAQPIDAAAKAAGGESTHFTDGSLPVLVVGAGPAGLAVMARMKQAGIAFEGAEKSSVVGQTTTHLHTSYTAQVEQMRPPLTAAAFSTGS